MCMASAVTTAWVSAPAAEGSEFDMNYTTYSGFEGSVAEPLGAVKKKATKRKATKKKAKATKAKRKVKKAATKTKSAGLYEGEDRIPRAVQGRSRIVSESEVEYEIDFDLDFDAVTDQATLVYALLAQVQLEDDPQTYLGMLLSQPFATSITGVPWNSVFRDLDYAQIVAALDNLPAEDGDAPTPLGPGTDPLSTLADALPTLSQFPNLAFLSGDMLSAPILGEWIIFPEDPSMPSFDLADVVGEIVTVPEPSAFALTGGGLLGLGAMRRRIDEHRA